MDKRIGVIGIVIEDLTNISEVNNLLHEYSEIIIGRMGVPYKERGVNVISLIVDGTTDQIGALSGKLGKLKGLSVKSALSKKLIGGKNEKN
ncbi:MAG TPA: CopG family transcriptional regulator [Tissierellia bacterium]|nr:CopG family transcriptional regulator [Tissierellia bacterium]